MSASLALNHVITRLRIKRIQCPIVYQCALLVSYLKSKGIDATVKKGFIEFAGNCCPHVWVETTDGQQLDIGTAYGMKFAPELSKFGIKLVEEPSENSKRMDTENEHKKMTQETEFQYDLYTSDTKQFWKDRPLSIRNLKL